MITTKNKVRNTTKNKVGNTNKPIFEVDTQGSAEAIRQTYNNYLRFFPPGYRFHPSEQELIVNYLQPKVSGLPLPPHMILDINIYDDHHPRDLLELFPLKDQEKWYVFTPRERKYKNGKRPSRGAGAGYWKMTSSHLKIKNENGKVLGYKNVLKYFEGKPSKGEKTNWIMYEFTLTHDDSDEIPKETSNNEHMVLDAWVLCRIYHKGESKETNQDEDDATQGKEEEDEDVDPNESQSKKKFKNSNSKEDDAMEQNSRRHRIPQMQYMEPMSQTQSDAHEHISQLQSMAPMSETLTAEPVSVWPPMEAIYTMPAWEPLQGRLELEEFNVEDYLVDDAEIPVYG